jgi:hypothetical protein
MLNKYIIIALIAAFIMGLTVGFEGGGAIYEKI